MDLENLAKEVASSIAHQGGLKDVKLENSQLTFDISIKDKNLADRVGKLSIEDNELLYKKVDEEISKIVNVGIKKEIRKKTIEDGIAKKWK